MTDDTPRALNEKQERFAQEYTIDFNATQAAIRAGYSAATAHAIGFKLLRKAEIVDRIGRIKEAQFAAVHMTATETLAELAHIARFRMGDILHVTDDGDPYLDLRKMDAKARAALHSVEIEDFVDRRERDEEGNPIARDVRRVKVRAHDKLGALNTLAKHHKLVTDKIEVGASEDFAALMEAAERRTKG